MRLAIKLVFGYNSHFSLGRLRLSVTDSTEPGFAVGEGVSQGLVEGLAGLRETGVESLTDGQKVLLLKDFARKNQEWMEASAAIRDHEARIPKPSFTKIQATAEGFAKPRHNANGRGYPHFYEQTYVLRRGDANLKLEPAEPRALPILTRRDVEPGHWLEKPPPGWERSGFHRASLAKWLTDSESGAGALLARVIVNRVWHHHFGTGIVATPSNFGAMGARPTHPELLAWLAGDLIQNGWLGTSFRMVGSSSACTA